LENKYLTWTKVQLQELIEEYKGVGSLTLQAIHDSQVLWEVRMSQSYGQNEIINRADDGFFIETIASELDRISATELLITDVGSKQKIDIRIQNWKEKFLDLTTVQGQEFFLIPDTNFVMRRYASGLQRKLGKDFDYLRFYIPNLVILEIEAIHNRAKKKSENRNCVAEERAKAFVEMRQALIATKELMFLRDKGANLLDSNIPRALENFQDIAGKGLTDMYIRKEIRDGSRDENTGIKFLTCDLMNALSAVAEGLPTLYFSRVKSETNWLSNDYETCLEQIAELIVNTTTIFDQITLTSKPIFGELTSKTFKGTWADWTIEDLLNDRIIEERQE
jgi:hypothetical protein